MIAAMLTAMAMQGAAAAEVWEPRITWGCAVSSGGAKPFVVNGVIAQRNEPGHVNVHRRFERALRVLRDDSKAFSGLQARSPMFVVHPKQYWAYFKGADGVAFGPGTRSIVLDKDAAGRPTRINLFAGGAPTAKPYATGPCVSRQLSAEIPE